MYNTLLPNLEQIALLQSICALWCISLFFALPHSCVNSCCTKYLKENLHFLLFTQSTCIFTYFLQCIIVHDLECNNTKYWYVKILCKFVNCIFNTMIKRLIAQKLMKWLNHKLKITYYYRSIAPIHIVHSVGD